MSRKKKDRAIQMIRSRLISKNIRIIRQPPKWLTDLAGAWTFYSILPSWPWPNATYEQIARFAPVIGVVTGGLQSILWLSLAFWGWSTETLALLAIAMEVLITGGLHLDGLMDTADGIGAGKARCIEAMKDSRVGSYGVLALVVVLLLQIAALISLDSFAPIAIPIAAFWSRCAPLWAIKRFSYLREEGSTSFHKRHSQFWVDILPAITLLIIGLITLYSLPIFSEINSRVISLIFLGILPTLLIPDLLGRHIGGHSGDMLGACQVLVQSAILLIMAVIFNAI